MARAGAPERPQRPGSRRYTEIYGGHEENFGPIMASGDAGDGSDAGGSDAGEGESVVEAEVAAYHKHPVRMRMVSEYRNARERSVRDRGALYDMLRDAEDIRDLDMDVLESILLNGREKQSQETLEDVIHSLCEIIRETAAKLEGAPPSDDGAAPVPQPHQQPVQQPILQAGARQPQPVQQPLQQGGARQPQHGQAPKSQPQPQHSQPQSQPHQSQPRPAQAQTHGPQPRRGNRQQ